MGLAGHTGQHAPLANGLASTGWPLFASVGGQIQRQGQGSCGGEPRRCRHPATHQHNHHGGVEDFADDDHTTGCRCTPGWRSAAAGRRFRHYSLHSPRRTVAASIADYSDLCASRPIPGAAEYRPGFGPHPIAVFGNAQDDVSTGGIQVLFLTPSETFHPTDPSSVQLWRAPNEPMRASR